MGIVITQQVCWLVGLVISWKVKIWCRCLLSASHFTINFWKLKVIVQSHISRTENLQILIAQPWFKLSLPNLAVRQMLSHQKYGNSGVKCDLSQNSRWWPLAWQRFAIALSECFLFFIFILLFYIFWFFKFVDFMYDYHISNDDDDASCC